MQHLTVLQDLVVIGCPEIQSFPEVLQLADKEKTALTPKSGLKLTLVRYQLPMVVIVFNNSGVYGSDRRSLEEIIGLFTDEPTPTSFIPGAAYHLLIDTFQGKGYLFGTPDELKSFAAQKPGVINVAVDPYAGAESGRLQHKN
ncbi:hypothetical protein RHSIM_RhsimUnG0182900 [Rhododendron simsii]|uniref:Thiamine pyrophosphate enzyme TPP-binding domain-containing protein n=1 Tax=Rhododendron simsii TaxID=118357 RepID=A0A834FWI8_RHOSS|nr:hypothetical protein RHSIM_RhsimUnG0182900 [Rhododendron simsii]